MRRRIEDPLIVIVTFKVPWDTHSLDNLQEDHRDPSVVGPLRWGELGMRIVSSYLLVYAGGSDLN